MVNLGLRKAFDSLDHEILIGKMRHECKIGGSLLRWFASYLTGRLQRVKWYNEWSPPAVMKCSVPQGTVSGPLLFNVYVNHLSARLEKCSYHFFTDDAVFYYSARYLGQVAHALNDDLYLVALEYQKLNLQINPSKSTAMFFMTAAKARALKDDIFPPYAWKTTSIPT